MTRTTLSATPCTRLMRAALAGTAALGALGAGPASAQQPLTPLAGGAPERGTYATGVVVDESFRLIPGGRELPAPGSAMPALLAEPESAARALELSLPEGIALGAGTTARVFEQAASPRAGAAPMAAPAPEGKLVTLHALEFRGVPLAVGSDVLSVATASGRLLAVRERNVPGSVDGSEPTVDRVTAQAAALDRARSAGAPASAAAGAPTLEVFVGPERAGRLAWRVRVEDGSLTAPWARDLWVAALGEPAILADREAIFHTHSGPVTANVWEASPLGASPAQPLPDAFVVRNGNDADSVVSAADGSYAFPTGSGAAQLTAGPRGPHSVVENVAGNEIEVTASGSPGTPIPLALAAAGDDELAQTSAFAAINQIRALVDPFLPAGALAELPTRVNINSSCNAFWNGRSVNFFRAGDGCVNTAYSDVAMHEYGHAVDAAIGGIVDGGYSEGFGDALDIIGTRQFCVGRDFFGAGTCLRDSRELLTWPSPSDEVHEVGRRYAGFVEALVLNLGPIFQPDDAFRVARDLVMGAAAANPSSIPDAVLLSFVVDDNDGDLATCSAHFWSLADAADSRTIPRPPDCGLGQQPAFVLANFGEQAGSWHVDKHPRFVADIDGDGRKDIVGFGDAGVWTSLSIGGGGFGEAAFVLANFGEQAGGWHVAQHPRLVGDVNGDGRADIVGFGDDGVWLSLSTGSGGFGEAAFVIADLGFNQGWRIDHHPRFLADVNGDRRMDVVGFGDDGVWVATSTGDGFAPPSIWMGDFAENAGGWRVDQHPRELADVNGDGMADIVGFRNDGAWVSLGTGAGFTQPGLWVADFGFDAGGWRVDKHPRLLGDVNGDGNADIVGFGDAGVWVSLSTGAGFTPPTLWIENFGFDAGGWRVDQHPRMLADVNGDGRMDVIGFGNLGVYRAISTGSSFTGFLLDVPNFAIKRGSWKVDKHPRFLADVTGDHLDEVVGFGDAGVWVGNLLH